MAKKPNEENKQSVEHTKNKRKSTKEKHETGAARKNRDRVSAKGLKKRPLKRPPQWRGPWP